MALNLYSHDKTRVLRPILEVEAAELKACGDITEVWQRKHGQKTRLLGYKYRHPSFVPSRSQHTSPHITSRTSDAYATAKADRFVRPIEHWERRILKRVGDRLISKASWQDRVVTA